MNLLASLEKHGKPFWIGVGLLFIIGIGILDLITGFEISFSLFYLAPIALISWFVGRRAGIAMSLASAGLWLAADAASGHQYSHLTFYVWNALIRLGFFIVVTLLITALRSAMGHEAELARTDGLTGAVNSRFFFDLLSMEIDRSRRYHRPFTIAYLDLDNFKAVNDQWGHATGDRVLRTIVECTIKQLRKTDIVARLGGDEFAVLLPETGEESAQVVVAKLQSCLLDEMQNGHWPVTFSIGVLTVCEEVLTGEEIVKRADELMYVVKRGGKNAVEYGFIQGSPR